MHLCRPLQLVLYVLLALLLAPVIPALSGHDRSISDSLYDDMIVHDARKAAPEGFVHVGNLADHTTIDLEIGLHGRDIPGLVKRLYEVSSPGSSSYGRHLSKEEAESYVRPTDEIVREVNAWLIYYGVRSKSISASGDRLQITIPVSKANKMFQAAFSTFRHTGTGTESFQALSYSLPSKLRDMVQSVEPTTSFPNPTTPAAVQTFTNSSNFAIPPCNQAITPVCLIQLYRMPTARITQAGNYISVVGFLNQYANRVDLGAFLANFRPDLNGATFVDQAINGGQNLQIPGTAGVEANIDIQYTVSLVNFDPVVFISSGAEDINGWIGLANYWLLQAAPPPVISISYGFNEFGVSQSSANTLCNLFAQLGTRGVSVIIASGDGGVSGSRLDNTCTAFVPTFPASCPYVTAVGATVGIPEVGAGLSAGGFSNYFNQPSYQTAAVNGYLNQIFPAYNGLFNPTGRAYPDVSAQGQNVLIFGNLSVIPVDGTSIAAPIFASIITLLNDLLISRTRTTLGFLNPVLYASSGILNDIIAGNNPGCNTNGFPAAPGWDPVTGLGTPNFPRMAGLQ